MTIDFAKPSPVSDVQLAFPADALEYMPPMEDIPAEFQVDNNDWTRLAGDWFGYGLSEPAFFPVDGVDAEAGYRHLSMILRSYAPKHDHKMAAVAYLASQWYVAVAYTLTIRNFNQDRTAGDQEIVAMYRAQANDKDHP